MHRTHFVIKLDKFICMEVYVGGVQAFLILSCKFTFGADSSYAYEEEGIPSAMKS